MPPGADAGIARVYRSAAAHSTVLIDGEGLASLYDVALVTGEAETRLKPLSGAVAPLRARSETGETLTLGPSRLHRYAWLFAGAAIDAR